MYNILEVANCHGGNIAYLHELLDQFKEFNKNNEFGIKFQPFKYDLIATSDYSWHDIYKKLFFNENEWMEVIEKAYQTKDIWLDIFDEYSIKILVENIEKIYGIKLQTSILDNIKIFQKLQNINLEKIDLVLNIAGRELEDIESIIKKYSDLNIKKIFLEIGFQGYPTEIIDSGIVKIDEIKKHFQSTGIVFADHIDSQTEDALILPILAGVKGIDIIEKHIMGIRSATEYDYFSSLEYDQYKKFIEMQCKYFYLGNQDFINEKESNYFEKTLQIPILNKIKKSGDLLDLENDFEFKRTDKKGMNVLQIKQAIKEKYILCSDKNTGDVIKEEDIKKANIAVIVACRLKSTRLKEKAILKIGKYPSIELCLKNIMKFKDINHIVLATSTTEEDSKLRDHIFNKSVIFHQGDPDDVIQRYLDIIAKKNIDVIIRVTGDCPYLSKDICQIVLNEHFEKGADYSNGIVSAVVTNIEVVNVNCLKAIKQYFPRAYYSEYMTWYFQNNSEIFKLNFVELPNKWKREYRLTLDYQEDLDLFNAIEKYFNENQIEYTIDELYKFLDENPEVVKINSHFTLKYKTDQKLIDTLNRETKIDMEKYYGKK
jgi:spore coat polysaccharide biosynthesis protein SpsF (cytidylyltransferase family)/sialic acid synthase SpsE